MIWTSPSGHVFRDPTDAMLDALQNCQRIRHQWCPRPEDLGVRALLCDQWYWRHSRVRRRVDVILADAGYTATDQPGDPAHASPIDPSASCVQPGQSYWPARGVLSVSRPSGPAVQIAVHVLLRREGSA